MGKTEGRTVPMNMILYSVLIAAGFIMLVKGADYFVDGSAGLAKRLGISEIIIGLTIVAMGTSAPEAAVSFTAAYQGNADIAVGNIVGSNILNILIILGVSSVIAPITVSWSTIILETPFMIFCSVILLLLGLDQKISKPDGIILWIFFLIYLGYLFLLGRKKSEEKEETNKVNGWKLGLFILGGLLFIIVGSRLAVWGTSELARTVGISERFISLTIVALGTSLPELFTSVSAARKGNADIAIGNIVGSNIFNILFIIGTSAFLGEVSYESKFFIDSAIVILSGVILFLCIVSEEKLTRKHGVIMLTAYLGYFVYLCLS